MPSTVAKTKARVERRLGQAVFSSRKWITKRVTEFAPTVAGGRVLEIGSGRQDFGTDAYSRKDLFADSQFVQSDVNPAFGHLVLDITTMEVEEEYDAILCLSVLEHVDRIDEAIARMRRALRPGGRLVLAVPMTFPYHDEPTDYWRFTTYGVRYLLREFSDVDISYRGPRRLPFTVFAVATK